MVNPLFLNSDNTINNVNNTSNNVSGNYKGITISFTELLYLNNKLISNQFDSKKRELNKKNKKFDFKLNIENDKYLISKDDSGNIYFDENDELLVSKEGFLQTPSKNIIQGVKSIKSSIYSSNGDFKFDNEYINPMGTQIIVMDDATISTINAKSTEYVLSDDLDSKKGNGFKSSYVKEIDLYNLIDAYKLALEDFSNNPIEGSLSLPQISSFSINDMNENSTITLSINTNLYVQKYNISLHQTLVELSDKISSIIGLSSKVNNTSIDITSVEPGKSFSVEYVSLDNTNIDIKTLQDAQKGEGLLALNSIRNTLSDAIVKEAGEFLEIKNDIIIDEETNIEDLILDLKQLELSNTSYDKIEIDDGVIYLTQDNNKFVVGQIVTADFENNTLEEISEKTYQNIDINNEPNFSTSGISAKVSQENKNISFLDSIRKRAYVDRSQKSYLKASLSSNDYVNLNIQLRA